MADPNQLKQLRDAGYENIFEKNGQYYVATGGTFGKAFDEMMPADKALELKAPPLNPPKPRSGHGGRIAKDQYKKTMSKILNEDDLLRERRRAAHEMSGTEAALIHAGRETDKFVAGAEDIGDIMKGMMGEDIMQNMARRQARAQEQAEKDEMYRPLSMESGLSRIGLMPLYMATGYSSPFVTGVASKGINLVGTGVKRGATTVGRTAVKEGRSLADLTRRQYKKVQPYLDPDVDDMIRTVTSSTGKQLKKEVVDPVLTRINRYKNREGVTNPFRGKVLPSTIGATGLGAAEGGIHYDDTMMEGAISSLLGHGAGLGYKNYVSRAPNLNSPAENAIIDKWKNEYGYRPLPGMETGIPEVQKVTSNARTDNKFASGVRQIDNANLDAISRVAADASGMDAKTLRNITPEEMNKHVQGLKARYEELEAQTMGIPDIDAFDNVVGLLDEYPKPTQTKIMNFIEKVEKGYEGKEYKNLRRELKAAHTKAIQGNRDEAEAYAELIKIMDDSIEEGIEGKLGPGLLEEWRDLNEKYAMTNFMLENGMKADGGVDARKLTNKLINSDSKRMLTGRGGRVGKFHDIARIVEIENKQMGGGLGSMNIDAEPGDKAPGLMATPAVGQMGPIRQLRFNLWKSGYPNKYGLLGLPREGTFSSERLMRAAEQGADPLVEAKDYARETYDRAKNAMLGLLQ